MPVTHSIIGTGITKRIITSISAPYGEEEFDAIGRMAEAYNSNTLENYLTPLESFCQNLLAKAQLPPWSQVVHVDTDGNWTEVTSKEEIKGLQSGAITTTFGLVKDKHGIDSELWFACEILAAIDRVRREIASHDPAQAAWAGIALAEIKSWAAFKFTWEKNILRDKNRQQGTSDGGKTTARKKQQKHPEWQAEANKIVEKRPSIKWSAVYAQVARKFDKSPSNVRKYIHDPR